MQNTNDYTHRYNGWFDSTGECIIRTYEAAGEPPVIVCSAVRSTTFTSTSITNICEYLAYEVLDQLYPHLLPRNSFSQRVARRRAETWPPFTWIEHYPPYYEGLDERELVAKNGYIPDWRREKWLLVRFSHYYPARTRGVVKPARVKLPDGSIVDVGDGAAGRTRIGYPDWLPITREYVEDLIGQPLD